MNSISETRKIKLEHWAETIHECMNSGMKVKDWCIQNQISKDTYYYWFKQVREAAIHHNSKSQSHVPSFVELPNAVVCPDVINDNAPLIIHIGKASIEVTNQTSSDTLSMVLGVLNNA